MSTTYYYCAVASVSVVLWVPILYNFLSQWRRRNNPVSLALAAAILLIMWWAIAGIWLISGAAALDLVVYSSAGASILTALCAHYAFHRSRLKFPDQRKKETH